eukprot:14627674-Heterocapsa_arctica.AAC.1
MNHWFFGFYEWRHLKFIKECLTTDWAILQGGSDAAALRKWIVIFEFLEFDRKAVMDLMLLAHSGLVGRSRADQVLWEVLSVWALKPSYYDLSHKVSHLVTMAR